MVAAKTRSLVVKVTDEEMNAIHALAHETEDSIAKVVRKLIREAWLARHGLEKPPRAKLKHNAKENGR